MIAIHLFGKLGIEELWIKFGTGKHRRWLSIHEYAANLGYDVCAALPFWFWYAFTGCDIVSSFRGRGKELCWEAWRLHQDVTHAFKR